ncbi:MAG: DsbA family protein [Eubacteriales bacterium]|nr:DsbA family protein [Eubacteriales bacterium]
MKIIFVTDYVCPYCIVGKAALKEAIRQLGIEVEIETLPMQLTMEGEPKVDTWSNQEKREKYKVLTDPAQEMGLNVKIPPFVVPRPYTRLAFEGHFYALEHGLADAYDDAMYRAYFVDERDIGELDVITDVAASVGLDPKELSEALQDGRYSETVAKADAYTKETLDVHSVPTLFIDGDRVQFKDYTVADAIRILNSYI